MGPTVLSERMKQMLVYKESINSAVKDIIAELGDNFEHIEKFRSVKVRQKIQDIYSYISAIGSLADNERSEQFTKLIHALQVGLTSIDMLGPYSQRARADIEHWLSMVNGITFRMDEKKGSWKVGLNFDTVTGKLGGDFEKHNF